MLDRPIQSLLPAFFSQLMIGEALNGYSSPSWVKQIQNPGGTIRAVIPLDEQESSAMETVMTDLRISHPDSYTILELYWGQSWSDGKIARESTFRCTTAEINQMRTWAENQIEARLGMEGEG